MTRGFGPGFYLSLFSPLFFVFSIDWFLILISGRWEIVPYLIWPEIVFYLIPILIIMIVFRIKLSRLGTSQEKENNNQRLLMFMPTIVTSVIVLTGLANTTLSFYIVTMLDPAPFSNEPWHIFLSASCGYVILPGFLAWVFVGFWSTGFRIHLFKETSYVFPAGKSKLPVQMIVVYFFVWILPVFNLILDVGAWMKNPDVFGSMFYTDIFAISFSIFLTVIVFTRKITNPIMFLEKAMNQVLEKGMLNQFVPVLDTVETGRLTVRFNLMLQGLRERDILHNSFGRYLTPELAKEVLARGGTMNPESRTVTVLFTDIENYTSLTETMPPSVVVSLLNEYFSGIIAIVNKYKGTVNKFIGDAVMVLFNAPLDDVDHGYHAVKAGMEIDQFCKDNLFDGIPLKTRIGINTGGVVAGNIGSEQRAEYTVIGDTVNVAQRLEAYNKELGTSILVGALTREFCGEREIFIPKGEVSVKGRTGKMIVYSIKSEP